MIVVVGLVVALAGLGGVCLVVCLLVLALKLTKLVTSPRLTYSGPMALTCLVAVGIFGWYGRKHLALAPSGGAPTSDTFMAWIWIGSAVLSAVLALFLGMIHAGVRLTGIAKRKKLAERQPMGDCPLCAEVVEGVPDRCPHCDELLPY